MHCDVKSYLRSRHFQRQSCSFRKITALTSAALMPVCVHGKLDEFSRFVFAASKLHSTKMERLGSQQRSHVSRIGAELTVGL